MGAQNMVRRSCLLTPGGGISTFSWSFQSFQSTLDEELRAVSVQQSALPLDCGAVKISAVFAELRLSLERCTHCPARSLSEISVLLVEIRSLSGKISVLVAQIQTHSGKISALFVLPYQGVASSY
jgi:hypothetical protein